MAKLKTKLDLLRDSFHVQTLGKILEKEVNIRITERILIIAKPSDVDYEKAKKDLPVLKKGLENLNLQFSIISEMIRVEEKNGKKV